MNSEGIQSVNSTDANEATHLNLLQVTELSDELATVPPTQMDTRSCSPRDKLSCISDRKAVKADEKFEESGQLVKLQRLILLFEMELMKKKPENIIDFAVDDFFSKKNALHLEEALKNLG